jgi:hypothetical protein
LADIVAVEVKNYLRLTENSKCGPFPFSKCAKLMLPY